jgi:hypothetical protein
VSGCQVSVFSFNSDRKPFHRRIIDRLWPSGAIIKNITLTKIMPDYRDDP